MKLLDIKALMEATEKVVTVMMGDVRVRRLSRIEYLSLLPLAPAQSESWKPADPTAMTPEEIQAYAVRKEQEWLESLSPEDRVGRRSELLEAMYAGLARAILEPRMTAEQVKRLGDDAFVIFQVIQDFWRNDVKTTENGAANPTTADVAA
jgi:hypothetical protein